MSFPIVSLATHKPLTRSIVLSMNYLHQSDFRPHHKVVSCHNHSSVIIAQVNASFFFASWNYIMQVPKLRRTICNYFWPPAAYVASTGTINIRQLGTKTSSMLFLCSATRCLYLWSSREQPRSTTMNGTDGEGSGANLRVHSDGKELS